MEFGPNGTRQHKPGARWQAPLCMELERRGSRSLTRVLAVLGIIMMLVTILALYHSGGVEGDVTVPKPGTGQVRAEWGHVADSGTNANWLAAGTISQKTVIGSYSGALYYNMPPGALKLTSSTPMQPAWLHETIQTEIDSSNFQCNHCDI